MPLNIASNTAKTRASFGPGVLYVGAAGTTPSQAIGLIGDDGVSFEVSGEMIDVMQGNPRMIEYSFFQSQQAVIGVSSLEWELTRLAYALGAGATAVSASSEQLVYGGEPCVTEVAVWVEHRKCTAVHTVNIRLWKAVSEAGAVSVGMNAGAVHNMAYRWKGLRAATDWSGASLASDRQLFQIEIEIT